MGAEPCTHKVDLVRFASDCVAKLFLACVQNFAGHSLENYVGDQPDFQPTDFVGSLRGVWSPISRTHQACTALVPNSLEGGTGIL